MIPQDMVANGKTQMVTVEVFFEGGKRLITRMNGTLETARNYYLGNSFELSDGQSYKAIRVEEIV